jgi:hypothetical protein
LPIIFQLSCIPAGASYTVNTCTRQIGFFAPARAGRPNATMDVLASIGSAPSPEMCKTHEFVEMFYFRNSL